MRLRVKVRAKARQNRVEPAGEGCYKVWVKAVPEQGKANAAVIGAIGEYLRIPKSRIKIRSGQTSSLKVLEIDSFERGGV